MESLLKPFPIYWQLRIFWQPNESAVIACPLVFSAASRWIMAPLLEAPPLFYAKG